MFVGILNRYTTLEAYQSVIHILTCIIHYVKTFDNVNFFYDDHNKQIENVIKSIFKNPKNMTFSHINDISNDLSTKDINFMFVQNKVNIKINFYLFFVSVDNIDEDNIIEHSKDNILSLYMFYTTDINVTDEVQNRINNIIEKYKSSDIIKFTDKVFVVMSEFNISDQKSVDIMTKNFEIIRHISDTFLAS